MNYYKNVWKKAGEAKQWEKIPALLMHRRMPMDYLVEKSTDTIVEHEIY